MADLENSSGDEIASRSPYQRAVRSPAKPRGKWHLLVLSRTICNKSSCGWVERERRTLNASDICANCLRGTA